MSAGAGFFHIDRRWWKEICDTDDLNMAVSYLTIATGTGKANRSSAWSAQAIEKYTGLHNIRATEAIKRLIETTGCIRPGEHSSKYKPRYELKPYDEGDSTPSEELIWLPNTLVTGTVNGERSPIGRLRSRGDMDALRLLIDLYQAQHLSAEGGISRRVLWQEYEREKCGERGRHIVWGFIAVAMHAAPHPSTHSFWGIERDAIWKALETLQTMRLLVVVPHLMENANPDCEPLHGFGWNGAGERLERELGKAADAAGRHILGDELLNAAENINGIGMFAPAWDSQPDVQMVGIFRLTYRPHTRPTEDWHRRMSESAAEWMKIYERLVSPEQALRDVSGF